MKSTTIVDRTEKVGTDWGSYFYGGGPGGG